MAEGPEEVRAPVTRPAQAEPLEPDLKHEPRTMGARTMKSGKTDDFYKAKLTHILIIIFQVSILAGLMLHLSQQHYQTRTFRETEQNTKDILIELKQTKRVINNNGPVNPIDVGGGTGVVFDMGKIPPHRMQQWNDFRDTLSRHGWDVNITPRSGSDQSTPVFGVTPPIPSDKEQEK